jgi:hypothetical protein
VLFVPCKPMECRQRMVEREEPREEIVQVENSIAHLRANRSTAFTPSPHVSQRSHLSGRGASGSPARAPARTRRGALKPRAFVRSGEVLAVALAEAAVSA